MTSFRFFFKIAAGNHIGFDLDNMRPPRSAIVVGISLVLKFGLDRIYSFGDIAILIFRRFGFKLPVRRHLGGGGWRHIPPNDVTHCPNSQKALPLTRKHVV